MGELKRTFRPEFLNRVDGTMVFHALSRDEIKEIVNLEMEKILTRLVDKEIGLEVTEEAKDYLAEEGYDPKFGARPLRRVLRSRVEDALSEGLLRGDFQAGDTVKVDEREGDIEMEVIARAATKEVAAQPEKAI